MRRNIVHFTRDAHTLVGNATRSEFFARALGFSQTAARLFHVRMVHAHAETAQGRDHYKRNVFDAHHKRHGDARSAHGNHCRAHAHHGRSRKGLAAGAFTCHGVDSHDGANGRKRNRSAHGIRQEDIACKGEREHEPRRLATKNQRRSRKGNRQICIDIRDVIDPARPIGAGINMHDGRSGDHHLGAAKRECNKSDGNVDSPIGHAAILGRGAFFRHPAENTARRNVVLHEAGEVFLAGSIRAGMRDSLRAVIGAAFGATLGATVSATFGVTVSLIFSATLSTITSMACGLFSGPFAMQRGPYGARRARTLARFGLKDGSVKIGSAEIGCIKVVGMFLYILHGVIVEHGQRFIHTASSVNPAIVQKGARMWHIRMPKRARRVASHSLPPISPGQKAVFSLTN